MRGCDALQELRDQMLLAVEDKRRLSIFGVDVQGALRMLRLSKAASVIPEEDLFKLEVVVVVGGALLAVDRRSDAASLAHVALDDALAAAFVVLDLGLLLYLEVVRLGWALIHEFFDDRILHKLRTDVCRVLLVAVNKVADFAEAELHRVHSQRASFVREDVPYLAQLLVDGAVKYFTLLV